MKIARLQFESRYIPILDFKEKYKTKLMPFLALKDVRFSVANPGTINEILKLSFDESFYEIEIMYDRLVFRFEGTTEDLIKPTSQIKLFFDVLNKIKEIDTFQKVLINILAIWSVIPLEKEEKEIVKDFKNRFIKESVNFLGNEVDFLIKIDSGDQTNFMTLDFGPYTSKDFKKHNISLFNSEYSLQFKKIKGILTIVQINDREEECNHSIFREKYLKAVAVLNKLDENYEVS
jgi:hypothetical protein